MRVEKWILWTTWLVISSTMAAYLTYRWNSRDQRVFLPGATSHGHYQIELACNACHTAWDRVKENACYDCHAEELKLANDSHPKSKFTDPRNADRLLEIDASNCITCHREHVPEKTRAMGVTVPDDYCYHCHRETLEERPSHQKFPFNSCSTAGCHNYHDNTALYENFLLKHLNEPDLKKNGRVPDRTLPAASKSGPRLSAMLHDAPAESATPEILKSWEKTSHAVAGVNCSDCHSSQNASGKTRQWSEAVDHNACNDCHAEETKDFLSGKHGMRLAQGLSAMQPAMARQPMKAGAAHLELTCASCHGAHAFDTRAAAVDSCLTCHNDKHSLAYKDSPHFALWKDESSGGAPGTGVSCATCHLPREERRIDGEMRVVVQHNQNANLRPNEKMVREVCLRCHGLEFTLNSLADKSLIQSNFRGRPGVALETMRLAEERSRQTQKK